MKKTWLKTRYRVHSNGECIRETDTYFKSLNEAKKMMKTHYKFHVDLNASLFILFKEQSKDNFVNDINSTHINTRTTIIIS